MAVTTFGVFVLKSIQLIRAEEQSNHRVLRLHSSLDTQLPMRIRS